MSEVRKALHKVRRIVVKVGTSTIAHDKGLVNIRRMEQLARRIADLKNQGYQVVLVSSGAIFVGAKRLNLKRRPRDIEMKQAAAAVGQVVLMNMYQKFFAEYAYEVAQVLVTKDIEENRMMKYHARNTMNALLSMGIVPIVNENDTVATDEIIFGDNDTLSAVVAGLIDADLLVLLSDIDGLFSDDPRTNPDALLISEVSAITEEVRRQAKGAVTEQGTGGMVTKVRAAELAMEKGIHVVLANSARDDILEEILSGKDIGTLFLGGKKHVK